jgi:hypothetical protein
VNPRAYACSQNELDEMNAEAKRLKAVFKALSDARDGTYSNETKAIRIEKDLEMAHAKYDFRTVQESAAGAAVRNLDLALGLAKLHLDHIMAMVHTPKCADWSEERKSSTILDAELPVSEAEEAFAAIQLKEFRSVVSQSGLD